MRFDIKQNGTYPPVVVQVLTPEGDPMPLEGVASVKFAMGKYGKQATVLGNGAIFDAAGSYVAYWWQPGDTTHPGGYVAEFEITFLDGRNLRVPVDDYIEVVVYPSVHG